MNQPCAIAVTCPCDNLPTTTYNSEAPDGINFLSTGYASVVPALGNDTWTQLVCMFFAESQTSQSAADMLAALDAQLCAEGLISPFAGEGSPPQSGFFSNEQSCTVNCPDGSPFTFTVPAGQFFSASSQMAADTAASTFACQQANVRAVCLGNLSNTTYTQGVPYTGTITATGGSLGANPSWRIVAGSLPTGINFSASGNTATLSGTASVSGSFTFTVQVTDPLGDTMQKTYTLNCGISYTVVMQGPSWVQGPAYGVNPDPGYDTIWVGDFNGISQLFLNFISPTAATWNWKAGFSGGSNIPGVTINGVPQFPAFSGSFSTNGCGNPIQVQLTLTSGGSGNQIFWFEWQTP